MSIQSVVDTMSQLLDAHRQLLELGEWKTGVIVRNEVEELNRIVGKETRLITLISELDRQRTTVIGHFLTEKGYRPHPYITVSDIVKLVVKMEEKQALHEFQQSLFVIIEQLKERNRHNQQLIEQSLAFIDFSLDVIAGAPEQDAVYQHPAQQQTTRRAGMFDTRA